MNVVITPFYAALLAMFLIVLSVRVIKRRRELRVALGDAGDVGLRRAIRAQGNFSEYVPLALLLLAFTEIQGAWPWLLHIFGVVLLAGRLSHAYGVSQEPEDIRYRVAGMAMTFTVLGSGALLCLWGALAGAW